MGQRKKESESYCECYCPRCASISRDKNLKWHKAPKPLYLLNTTDLSK